MEKIHRVKVVGNAEPDVETSRKCDLLDVQIVTLNLENSGIAKVVSDLRSNDNDLRIIAQAKNPQQVQKVFAGFAQDRFAFVRLPSSPDDPTFLSNLESVVDRFVGPAPCDDTESFEFLFGSVPENLNYRAEILVIGISTGGPGALSKLMPKLPADLPCPVLIAQHLPASFTESLAGDLNRKSPLSVLHATDGQSIERGCVYLAPGGKQMKVVRVDGQPTIKLTNEKANYSPSVDYLCNSVAETYGGHCLVVIMTGMGDDGTKGCKKLKLKGAKVIAQDRESSVVFGMPRSIIEANLADYVSSLDEMDKKIVEVVQGGVRCL